MPEYVGNDDSNDINLIVNELDGTLWLSKGDKIWHLTSSGQSLLSLQLSGEIETFTLIPSNQHIWVATTNTAHIYQQTDGLLLQKIAIDSEVEVLAYDNQLKEVWIASDFNLFRYSTNGISTHQQSFSNIESIEVDGKGRAWIAADNDLFYVDVSGTVLFQLTPFNGEVKPEIESVRLDPVDQTAWVAGKVGLVQVDTQGVIRQRIQLNSEVDDLALYSDIIAPVLSFLLPTQESYINTATPTLSLQYSDNGIGTDTSTLNIQENGLTLPITCQHVNSISTCTPDNALIEGLHTLDATVEDYAGNSSLKASTSFTVDTITPTITVNSHWNGAFVNQSAQALSGSLSEFATLDINGLPITLGLNHIFTYPVLLLEGQNNFLFTAKDQASNVGTFPFILFLDSVPPTAANVGSIVVADVINAESIITGQAGSVEGDATVEVTNLSTNIITTVQAKADGSFSLTVQANPNDKLDIVVIDKAGNRSAESIVQVPLPLSIAITSPVDLTSIQGDTVNVEGTFKGPVNTGITINGEVAAIIDDKFYVDNLNLQAGVNTVTAYLSTPDGTTLQYAISITSNAPSIYSVDADPYSGMAPLLVNFDIDETQLNATQPSSIQSVNVDFESDGVVDYTSTDLTLPINFTYALPGKYLTTTTIVDINGVTQTYQNYIIVYDPVALDTKLRSIYTGMLDELITGNVDNAMHYLTGTMQAKFKTSFINGGTNLANIIPKLGSIAGGALINGDLAEYVITRFENGQQVSFAIYLVKGRDGVWRIGEM